MMLSLLVSEVQLAYSHGNIWLNGIIGLHFGAHVSFCALSHIQTFQKIILTIFLIIKVIIYSRLKGHSSLIMRSPPQTVKTVL